MTVYNLPSLTTPTLQEVTDEGATTTDPISVGGLTIPTFTEGSVPFIGIGGLFNQNNQNLFWNTNSAFNNNTLNISGALGSEQITNGSFTGSATGWTLGTGWAYASNAVSKTSNGTAPLTQTISTMVNQTMGIVSITVSALTVGSITVSVGNTFVGTISANGTYTYRFISSSTSGIVITPTNTARLTVDDVSVRYLTGGGLVVGGNSYFRSKMFIAQNNTSTTLGNTSDHLELINTTTSNAVTNFTFKFAQTALSGIQANLNGTLNFIATNISSGGGFTWRLGSNVSTLSDYGNLDVNGWSTSENGRFAKKVIAGLNTVTAPATLNNNGSYAGRGALITTTNTVLTNAYEFVYLDSTLTAGCTGTTAVVCSAQTNSTDCNNNSALGCISNFGNCIDLPDQETCDANSPCAWVSTADCSDFNSDEGACTTTSGCTANYDGDCTVFGDETACLAESGCAWDGGCTGMYYTSCSGTYDITPYCSGSEYGSCDGTASCGNITSEATCDATSPCVWGEQQIVFLPSIANARQNNMSLKYAIKKTGGIGNSIVKPFDTTTTIEGATEKVFSTIGDSIVIHFFDTAIVCSSYGNETACNGAIGCEWNTEDPENPYCAGTPTRLPSWNIIADKV